MRIKSSAATLPVIKSWVVVVWASPVMHSRLFWRQEHSCSIGRRPRVLHAFQPCHTLMHYASPILCLPSSCMKRVRMQMLIFRKGNILICWYAWWLYYARRPWYTTILRDTAVYIMRLLPYHYPLGRRRIAGCRLQLYPSGQRRQLLTGTGDLVDWSSHPSIHLMYRRLACLSHVCT